jgi:hypothetical protein
MQNEITVEEAAQLLKITRQGVQFTRGKLTVLRKVGSVRVLCRSAVLAYGRTNRKPGRKSDSVQDD